MTTPLASDPVFSNTHILLTAGITAAFTLAAAAWRLGRKDWLDAVGVAIAAGASVFLFRASANMPQLNADGISGFSANDWLAPAMTFVFVSLFAAIRPPADPRRFNEFRALATVASLAVNVITI
jgi:hypothetical protein